MSIIVMSLSIMSHCQRLQLLSYLISASYVVVRTYFLIDEKKKWARQCAFIVLGFIASYIVSRVHMGIKRDNFAQKAKMRQVLSMFQSMLRAFHDGLVLTEDDNIVYSNFAIETIFNLNEDKKLPNSRILIEDNFSKNLEGFEGLSARLRSVKDKIRGAFSDSHNHKLKAHND